MPGLLNLFVLSPDADSRRVIDAGNQAVIRIFLRSLFLLRGLPDPEFQSRPG